MDSNMQESLYNKLNQIIGITPDEDDTNTPYVGQKIRMISCPDWLPANEAIRLSKLEYLTVSEYLPMVTGSDGNYKKTYQLFFNETDSMIPPEHFKPFDK
jgi:hypothetical protein